MICFVFFTLVSSYFMLCCNAKICYNIKMVVGGLQNPLAVDFIDSNRMLIAEHAGMLQLFDFGERSTTLFLNITDRILTSMSPTDDRGLLGMALDPNFHTNRFLYVFYSTFPRSNASDHDNVISRLEAEEDNGILKGIPGSVLEILRIAQPGRRQNGGQLFFNDDGHLYVTTGNSQDRQDSRLQLNSLLGKILRINVRQIGKNRKYSIPEDNPFSGHQGARPEIYAYGFWNPWRCTVDKEASHSKIFCGDVGGSSCNEENLYEIVRGGRYGWWTDSKTNCTFSQARKLTAEMKETDELPIHTYKHDEGQAVVGGIVYRSHQFPELKAHFVFADYVHGTFHALRPIKNTWVTEKLCVKYPSHLHSDNDHPHVTAVQISINGEIFVIANTKMNKLEKTGAIYKFSNAELDQDYGASRGCNYNSRFVTFIVTSIACIIIML